MNLLETMKRQQSSPPPQAAAAGQRPSRPQQSPGRRAAAVKDSAEGGSPFPAAVASSVGHLSAGHLQRRVGGRARHPVACSFDGGPLLPSDVAAARPSTPLVDWLVSSLTFSDGFTGGDGATSAGAGANASRLPAFASADRLNDGSFSGRIDAAEADLLAAASRAAFAGPGWPVGRSWDATTAAADGPAGSARAAPGGDDSYVLASRHSQGVTTPLPLEQTPFSWAQAAAPPNWHGSSSGGGGSSSNGASNASDAASARAHARGGGSCSTAATAAAALPADAHVADAVTRPRHRPATPFVAAAAARTAPDESAAGSDALVRQLVALVQSQAAQIQDLRDCLAVSRAGGSVPDGGGGPPTHRRIGSRGAIPAAAAAAAAAGLAGRPPVASVPRKDPGGGPGRHGGGGGSEKAGLGPTAVAVPGSAGQLVMSYSGASAYCHDSAQSVRSSREVAAAEYGTVPAPVRADGGRGDPAREGGRDGDGDAGRRSGAAGAHVGDAHGGSVAAAVGWCNSGSSVADAGNAGVAAVAGGGGCGSGAGRPCDPAPGAVAGRQGLLALLDSGSEPSAMWAAEEEDAAPAAAPVRHAGQAAGSGSVVCSLGGAGGGDSSATSSSSRLHHNSWDCLGAGFVGARVELGLPAPQTEQQIRSVQAPRDGGRCYRQQQQQQQQQQERQQQAWLSQARGLQGQCSAVAEEVEVEGGRAAAPLQQTQTQQQPAWWASEATLRLEVCSLQQRLARLEETHAAQQQNEEQRQHRDRDCGAEPQEQPDAPQVALRPSSAPQQELQQLQQQVQRLLEAQSERERQLEGERTQQAARLEALGRDLAAVQGELRRQEEAGREAMDQLAKGMEHVSGCILSALLPQADAGAMAVELPALLTASSPAGGGGAGAADSAPGSTTASPPLSPRPTASASFRSRSGAVTAAAASSPRASARAAASPLPYDVKRQLRSLQQEMRRMRAAMAARVVLAASAASVGWAGSGGSGGGGKGSGRARQRDGLTARGTASARSAADDDSGGNPEPRYLVPHQQQQQVVVKEQLRQTVQQLQREFLELRNGEALMVEAQEALVDLVYEMRRDLDELRTRMPYTAAGACAGDGLDATALPDPQQQRPPSSRQAAERCKAGTPKGAASAASATPSGARSGSTDAPNDLCPEVSVNHLQQQQQQRQERQPQQQQLQQQPLPHQESWSDQQLLQQQQQQGENHHYLHHHQPQQLQPQWRQDEPDQMSEMVAVIQSVNTLLSGSLTQAMSQIQSQGEEIQELKRCVARVAGSQPSQ
ncbi:hypothetical protein PLESTB_001786500 [Pleodorina starrii]|uniref:Uncharacterized protein n=1 Tax=Pleodorina starrii TaxID=330485 RepID=A0A9W6F9Q6_9CHLO|nr:hypothetical protein PLESTM_001757300 [Pleodorina starrii]GLC61647.1 hypothetical protein PLESTB_001786500 [Pleodorina starrii]